MQDSGICNTSSRNEFFFFKYKERPHDEYIFGKVLFNNACLYCILYKLRHVRRNTWCDEECDAKE